VGPTWAWALLVVILLTAARDRFRLPQTPFADPDTWTYLRPGLAQVLGEGFQHSLGQSFLYPAFLEMVMRGGRDLRWVCATQHALGLAGGALLFLAWCRAGIFFPALRGGREALYLGLGLLVVLEEQFSLSLIQFEHALRPEALFAPFAALQVWLLLEFSRARWLESRPRAALLSGIGAVFVSGVLFFLKPAVGLALIPANLPVVLSLLTSGMSPGRKAVLVAAPALALLFLLFIPEWRLRRSDPEASAFLPETLFTVHANLILQQMTEDLADGASVPYPHDWLVQVCASLRRELARSAAPAERPYPSLGFNPDYLKSGDSIILQLRKYWRNDTRPLAAFCSYYYWRTVAHHPAAMAGKVLRQLGVFYGQRFCRVYHAPKRYPLAQAYKKSVLAFAPSSLEKMDRYPPTRAYLRQCEALRRRADLPVLGRSRAYLNLNGIFARAYLPLGLGWLALLLAGFWWKVSLRPAVLVILWLHAYSFGINLTLATTHSLDVTRYSQNQLVFLVLAEGFTAALFLDVLWAAVRGRRLVREA